MKIASSTRKTRRNAGQNKIGMKARSAVVPLAAGFAFASLMAGLVVNEGSMSAIAAAITDPSSAIAARSPGERRPGALFATKAAKVAAPAAKTASKPSEPGKSDEPPAAFAATPGTPEPSAFAAVPDTAPSATPTAAPAAMPDAAPAASPGSPIFVPGPSPFIPVTPGVPGPGTNPTDPTDPTDPTNPVDPGTPGAVPEPATWLMLITGFFLTGQTMRRRQRRASADTETLHRAG